jgi:dynein assembly factor 1
LWLDSNGFEKIEGLETMTELRCLYLSKNLINELSGFETLLNLQVLDLSNNRITKLSNLSCLTSLNSINLGRNSLRTPASIEHLKECKTLATVDLTNNKLEDDTEFIETFATIPSLCTLSVNGNEITKIAHFRKQVSLASTCTTQ